MFNIKTPPKHFCKNKIIQPLQNVRWSSLIPTLLADGNIHRKQRLKLSKWSVLQMKIVIQWSLSNICSLTRLSSQDWITVCRMQVILRLWQHKFNHSLRSEMGVTCLSGHLFFVKILEAKSSYKACRPPISSKNWKQRFEVWLYPSA